MNSLLSYKGIEADTQLFRNALDIFNHNNIHIVDAIIIAKAKLSNIPPLTFDTKLEKIYNKTI